MGHTVLAVLLKFLLFVALPAVALWFVAALVTAPLAGVMPGYLKMVLNPVWFITSFFTALLGWKKRFSFWTYFLIALLLTPLVGLVVVIATDKPSEESHE